MVTIKQVAKQAGVSVATVSRVINEDPKVKKETALQVKKVINEMDYNPNLLGRQLRRQSTKNILILIPTIDNQFYSAVINGIEDELRNNGLNAFTSVTHSDKKIERQYFKMLRNKTFDGVILFSTELTPAQLVEELANIPVVQCCEREKGSPFSYVGIDNYKAAADAAQYLLDTGHQHIAMVSNPRKILSTAYREAGYHDTMIQNGQTPMVIDIDFSMGIFENGRAVYQKLINNYPNISAVFTISDLIAAGIAKEMQVSGKKKLSVFGFDDTNITEITTPTLSTVQQPRYAIGKKAAHLLMQQIGQACLAPQIITLNHTLILRESTAGLSY